jgi:hypothetical protein
MSTSVTVRMSMMKGLSSKTQFHAPNTNNHMRVMLETEVDRACRSRGPCHRHVAGAINSRWSA